MKDNSLMCITSLNILTVLLAATNPMQFFSRMKLDKILSKSLEKNNLEVPRKLLTMTNKRLKILDQRSSLYSETKKLLLQ